MKKIISLLLVIFCFQCSSYALEFIDVPQGFWAYEAIDKLTDNNIISGYNDNSFRPNEFVTRAQYATMVIKALEQENIEIEQMYSFEDVDTSHWAWPYIVRAVNLDIMNAPSDNYFYPDEYVTRTEMITFLVNILKTEDITNEEAINALQNYYIDFDDIPDWLKVPAGKAEVINVIAKEPPRQHYLDCDANITRAQMAVFLHNLKRELFSYKVENKLRITSPKIETGLVIENVKLDGDIATIPSGTVLPIQILGQLSSDENISGQMFQAKLIDNIVCDDHHLLLSKDMVLIGKILNAVRSKNFVRNGSVLIDLSSVNYNNNFIKIYALAEYSADIQNYGKLKRATNKIIKGKEFVVKNGQTLYVKLYKPIRVNIVTSEILD